MKVRQTTCILMIPSRPSGLTRLVPEPPPSASFMGAQAGTVMVLGTQRLVVLGLLSFAISFHHMLGAFRCVVAGATWRGLGRSSISRVGIELHSLLLGSVHSVPWATTASVPHA